MSEIRLEDMRPSEDESAIALSGFNNQAEAHGLDMTDPKLIAYIKHCAEYRANMSARMRGLQGIVHQMSGIED